MTDVNLLANILSIGASSLTPVVSATTDHPPSCGCPACAGVPVDKGPVDLVGAVDTGPVAIAGPALTIGGTTQGTIATSGGTDRYAIDLVAGTMYTFAMVGTGANAITDSELYLFGPDGATQLAYNDDGLQNNNSIITFTATASGKYFIDASGYGTKTGQYGLSITQGTRAVFDVSMLSSIIDTHTSWSSARGTGAVVTFGFRDTNNGTLTNFSHFSEAQKAATRQILQMYSEVCGITFVEVAPGGFTDTATLLLANYSASDGTGGHASYPGSTAATASAGDVWMNTTPIASPLQLGTYAFYALMHEIGHAIGLSHPGVYNAGSGGTISYDLSAQFAQDTIQYTNMSYWDESNTGGNLGGYGDVPMLLDIAALQLIYGTNTATRTGDTVYGFGSTAGDAYDFAINTKPGICIWDGGGSDTLDTSNYSAVQSINLNAGTFSNVGGLTNNVSIAYGVTVENANGGWGNDTITGNAAANSISGAAGNDMIDGGAGDDTLTGGIGNDSLTGGLGNDVLIGDGSALGQAAVYGLTLNSGATGQSIKRTGVTGLPTTAITIQMDVKFSGTPAYQWFVAVPGISFLLDPTNTGAPGLWILVNGSWTYSEISVSQLGDAQGHQITFSWDSSTGTFAHYLDGILIKTGTNFQTGVSLGTGTGTVTVNPLSATVGDFQVYTTALDATAIFNSAHGVAPTVSPVLNWHVSTGGAVTDLAGGTAPTVVAGTGTAPAVGIVSPASTFNDTLNGGLGNDTLMGGDGSDALSGSEGNDTIVGDSYMLWTENANAVNRLYLATLDRAPDSNGQIYWTGFLDNGASLTSIATGFVNSPEFQQTYGAVNSTQFVTLLYNNVLHRPPESDGLTYWVNCLNSGWSRESVVVGFSESAEFRVNSDPELQTGQIYRLFGATLDRQPDGNGLEYWTNTIADNVSLSEVVGGFIGSSEFQATYGNLDNSQFVSLLYNNVLDRASDQGGLNYWVGLLNSGTSRADVVLGFSESSENKRITTSGLITYMRTIRPDWNDTIDGGAGNDILAGDHGADTFVFRQNEASADQVYGFEAWDYIKFEGFGYTNSAQTAPHLTQVGANVIFSDQGQTINFHETTLNEFTNVTWVFA